MRTQFVREQAPGLPRLERETTAGQPPEVLPLESFPFTIGRSDEADLHVDSTRVSREHAIILRQGVEYRVQDNGSTNGTFLNGRRVQDAPLADGDMVKIADVEFCFFSGRQDQPRDLATQVMTQPGSSANDVGDRSDQVRALRRLHEALSLVALVPRFQPVVSLDDGRVHGYEALEAWDRRDSGASESERLLATAECRLAARWHQIHRLAAAEQAARFTGQPRVFLNLSASEIGNAAVLDSLERLAAVVGDPGCLVCEVPDHAVSESAYFLEFRARLRAWSVGLACDGVTAGPAQLREHRAIAPEYIKLAPALARDVHRNVDRRRQLQAIARAAADLHAVVIATNVSHPRDAEACRDLGCSLAQGDHFGAAQPAAHWSVGTGDVWKALESAAVAPRLQAARFIQPRS